MCHTLYIASDKPLPLVEWNEEQPSFFTAELQEHEEGVRNQFTLPFVVYAGTFEGCSCGFVYDDEPIGDNEFEKRYDKQARESVRRLGEYISKRLYDSSVEMFSCWEGEHENEAVDRLVVGFDFFTGKAFGLETGRHFTIKI